MNSGSVHVRSYTQMRDGKTVTVSEYDRAAPGTDVSSPFDGKIRIDDAYSDPQKKEYKIVTVVTGQTEYRYFYVSPTDGKGTPLVKSGDNVTAGQKIGTVQNIAKSDRNGKMHNHIHFAIRENKSYIDPTPQIEAWKKNATP